VRDIPVTRVVAEELPLSSRLLLHGLVGIDVGLAATDDADEAELERVDATGKDVEGVRSSVHEVELGENSNGTAALRVDGASELERLGVGQVDIGGRDGEDDAIAEGSVSISLLAALLKAHQLGLET